MEGRLLLDVVIRKGTSILKLLASEDEALLIRGDALLVLDLRLDVVDRVRGLDLEGNGLTRQGLDENLHATTQTEDQVKGRLLLDVIVGKGATILELLAGEDQALLVRGDALLVLDLRLDIVDGVRRLDLEGDRLAGEGLDEDLHSTAETEDEMEGGLLLDVVVRESAAILELLASEDQALLVRRDALLILDLGLDIVNGVRGFNLQGDGFASERLCKRRRISHPSSRVLGQLGRWSYLYEDLHGWRCRKSAGVRWGKGKMESGPSCEDRFAARGALLWVRRKTPGKYWKTRNRSG